MSAPSVVRLHPSEAFVIGSTIPSGLTGMGQGIVALHGAAVPAPAAHQPTTTKFPAGRKALGQPGPSPIRDITPRNTRACPHCQRMIHVLSHGRLRPHAVPVEMRRFLKVSEKCPGA